jgi:3D (Asp-Asp-Asp) domain-containing protein
MFAKLILLGVLTVTAYRPVPEQTKPECKSRNSCYTAIGENVNELGLAVSQDLLKSGKVHYYDTLCIEGLGCRSVFDCMASSKHNQVDLLVYTYAEEHRFGVRKKRVWLVQWPERINPRELSTQAR